MNQENLEVLFSGSDVKQVENLQVIDSDFVIVTSCQNNSKVNHNCLSELLRIKKALNAEFVVMPIYYNKKAFDPHTEQEDLFFDQSIVPYLIKNDTFLFSKYGVKLATTAAVNPTNKLPVNAAKNLNTSESITVVASTKQQFSMLPVLENQSIKAGLTTGTISNYNYKVGRAGSEAETDHIFGAWLFVREKSGFKPYNLQLGKNGKISLFLPNHEKLLLGKVGIKLGDLHCEMFDKKCWSHTIDYLAKLRPHFVAVDDILHFSSRSHHNRHSGKHLYSARDQSVESELLQVVSQLDELAQYTKTLYITESNHNSAIDQWLDDQTYKPQLDPTNSKLYYLFNYLVYAQLDKTKESITALETVLSSELFHGKLASNIEWGKGNISRIFNGCDFSQHGHKGQNGSRGSVSQFSKWRVPLVTGHTHSPSLLGNVITAGVTAKKQQGYNRLGASNWAQADAIIHYNEAQQLYFKEVFSV